MFFRRFAKESYTIHQFIFSAVDVSFGHPVGVEMKYRKYVSDDYPEVVNDPDPNSELGVKIQIYQSETFPKPGTDSVNILLGIPGIFNGIVNILHVLIINLMMF